MNCCDRKGCCGPLGSGDVAASRWVALDEQREAGAERLRRLQEVERDRRRLP